MPRPAPKNRGFTLIELMIALVIMAIMVATIAPALSEVLADNRQASAAFDIVRVARRARERAISTGVAHLLRIRTSGTGSHNALGTIAVYAGMNGRCMQTRWDVTFTPTGGALGPHETFDMIEYNPTNSPSTAARTDRDRPVIYFETRFNIETGSPHTAGVQVCYQPNGEIFVAATSTASATALAVQAQPLLITVGRHFNDTSRGVARQVLFPLGGDARLR